MLEVPIIQGGMGVGISLGHLAGAVMKEGGIGVISAAHPGYREKDFWTNSCQANCRALEKELQIARNLSQGHGLLGVNIMTASQDYASYVECASRAGVDIIFSGAGLPLSLPQYVQDENVKLAPIVSSRKALELIQRVWQKRYQRAIDLIVIEGSLAGGHLGFKKADLENQTCQSLAEILADVLDLIADWPNRPEVYVAGGCSSYADLKHFQSLGATGIQMGTRFITTEECDASPAFKEKIAQSSLADVALIQSPTGFPGRAIKNACFQNCEPKKISGCIHCLKMCNPEHTPYCITRALIAAVQGDVEHGLVFTGASIDACNKIESVKDIMNEMKGQKI